ncbi:hypothetical protein AOQ84DRAFT_377256 [Glonium stellatum]|uniref:C2H2-type domain-containing protein n=1 Tax=Glonium stellatum TaxID=574774 RepID=A0A8E2F0J5_9PEZI|nr:hypothetical protein AOQ84DRAFT_377256 [Glonium stellatum]
MGWKHRYENYHVARVLRNQLDRKLEKYCGIMEVHCLHSWHLLFTATLVIVHIRERDIWRLLYWTQVRDTSYKWRDPESAKKLVQRSVHTSNVLIAHIYFLGDVPPSWIPIQEPLRTSPPYQPSYSAPTNASSIPIFRSSTVPTPRQEPIHHPRFGSPGSPGQMESREVDPSEGKIPFIFDVKSGSKAGDKKRKRNAGAAQRFRTRNKLIEDLTKENEDLRNGRAPDLYSINDRESENRLNKIFEDIDIRKPDRTFKVKADWKRHFIEFHDREKIWTCTWKRCIEPFRSPHELKQHLICNHGGICECGRECGQNLFNEHLFTFHGSKGEALPRKVFVCGVIGCTFVRNEHNGWVDHIYDCYHRRGATWDHNQLMTNLLRQHNFGKTWEQISGCISRVFPDQQLRWTWGKGNWVKVRLEAGVFDLQLVEEAVRLGLTPNAPRAYIPGITAPGMSKCANGSYTRGAIPDKAATRLDSFSVS